MASGSLGFRIGKYHRNFKIQHRNKFSLNVLPENFLITSSAEVKMVKTKFSIKICGLFRLIHLMG